MKCENLLQQACPPACPGGHAGAVVPAAALWESQTLCSPPCLSVDPLADTPLLHPIRIAHKLTDKYLI